MRNMTIAGAEAPVTTMDTGEKYLSRVTPDLLSLEPDIILLPEKWISNVFLEGSEKYRTLVKTYERLSSELGLCIVPGSYNVQRPDGLFNSAPVFSNGELLGWQDKIIPFNIEKEYYMPGREIRTFSINGFRIGVQVCYDLDFPFVTKMQVSEGIDVILNPSLVLGEFRTMWHLYVKTRSLENRIPVISLNSVSEPFLGSSISTYFTVREKGVILRTRRARNGILRCTVSTNAVRRLSSYRRREDPGNYSLEGEEE